MDGESFGYIPINVPANSPVIRGTVSGRAAYGRSRKTCSLCHGYFVVAPTKLEEILFLVTVKVLGALVHQPRTGARHGIFDSKELSLALDPCE